MISGDGGSILRYDPGDMGNAGGSKIPTPSPLSGISLIDIGMGRGPTSRPLLVPDAPFDEMFNGDSPIIDPTP